MDVVDDECKLLDKLLLPELDDDEVLITIADVDVVLFSWLLIDVDGRGASRSFASNTDHEPSKICWSCANLLNANNLLLTLELNHPG